MTDDTQHHGDETTVEKGDGRETRTLHEREPRTLADTHQTDYRKGDKQPLNHGTKIRAKVKRGNGTRDQDELLIEGRGECAAEAAKDFEDALAAAESRNWAERLRAIQPGEEEQDDE